MTVASTTVGVASARPCNRWGRRRDVLLGARTGDERASPGKGSARGARPAGGRIAGWNVAQGPSLRREGNVRPRANRQARSQWQRRASASRAACDRYVRGERECCRRRSAVVTGASCAAPGWLSYMSSAARSPELDADRVVVPLCPCALPVEAVMRKRAGAPFSVPVPQNCAGCPETTSISIAVLSKSASSGIQNFAVPLGTWCAGGNSDVERELRLRLAMTGDVVETVCRWRSRRQDRRRRHSGRTPARSCRRRRRRRSRAPCTRPALVYVQAPAYVPLPVYTPLPRYTSDTGMFVAVSTTPLPHAISAE